jgi:hypothetical protein
MTALRSPIPHVCTARLTPSVCLLTTNRDWSIPMMPPRRAAIGRPTSPAMRVLLLALVMLSCAPARHVSAVTRLVGRCATTPRLPRSDKATAPTSSPSNACCPSYPTCIHLTWRARTLLATCTGIIWADQEPPIILTGWACSKQTSSCEPI